MRTRFALPLPLIALAGAALLAGASTGGVGAQQPPGQDTGGLTPIQHLVVIFQENVSFDHYFGTYPFALNPAAEPQFVPSKETPTVNGLCSSVGPYLLQASPGTAAMQCQQQDPLLNGNNPNLLQPMRFSRAQQRTPGNDHSYSGEQKAYDSGLVDNFVKVDASGHPTNPTVMDYYDGNTVTALWNYAQSFALNDNSFSTGFGPSTPGALNLVSGQTNGFTPNSVPGSTSANGTVVGDPDPLYDVCSGRNKVGTTSNRNIGNLLSLHTPPITWGWFQGGFRDCTKTHTSVGGATTADYMAHHEPFQYYQSTANPAHTPPASVAEIGHDGVANHQYDLTDFWAAVDAQNMPAVSFLKAPAYQDGHSGYSDPEDEQQFLVDTINRLEQTAYWNSTAVVIAYDDSDGWYDHVMPPIVNQSHDSQYDALRHATSGTLGDCGTNPNAKLLGIDDRCGYGPRQPLLVISPFAKSNFVDNTLTDQTSILRFIEDNWQVGRIGNGSMDIKAGSLLNMFQFPPIGPVTGNNKLFLDPCTGERAQPTDETTTQCPAPTS